MKPIFTRTVRTMLAAAVMLALALAPSGTANPLSGHDAPRTDVMLTVSPNPSHPGESVQFQWTATGFHGVVTCNDSQGWIINGPGSGTLPRTAGVHFTSSFRWTVTCDDGDFYASSYVDVQYIQAPPPPPPPGPPPPVSIIENDSNLVTFRNQDGDWTIWKVCSSPQGGPTVGPGYIAKLVTPSPGRITVLNDWAGAPGGLNGMRGGLGAFGLHYARGTPPFDLDNSNTVADMTGRNCYSSVPGGQGVYRVDIAQGPLVDGSGTGVFDLNVWIRDEWGNTGYGPDNDGNSIGDAGLKLSYVLRFSPSVVKHWSTVTSYFSQNGVGRPFAKEPKFTGSLPNTAAGYKRIAVFGGTNGLTFLRAFMGTRGMGGWHSDELERLRVRYDFADTTDGGADPHCQGTISPCLNVLFRAIPPSGPWRFWEQPAGSNAGLDKWATDVDGTTRANAEDQPNALKGNGLPYPWNCNATSDATAPFNSPEESTRYQEVRRWEFGGINPGNGYTQLMMLANGWEGGRGNRDCESTSMQFPAPGTSYSVEMDYSIDAGW
jgi:hypothetical protein